MTNVKCPACELVYDMALGRCPHSDLSLHDEKPEEQPGEVK